MTLTTSLGGFVADLSPNRLPDEAVRVASVGLIDGTMIVGRNQNAGDSGIPANVLSERLAAIQSVDARDLTARRYWR
jgi:hypothetical protein